ncbi:A-type potassium channel modulatory protein KCNIP1-like isoform X3 [Styela clava]|uniref:Kv channel-interacting protein 1-like isoform X2 n=1 Tax=Styela clava TaxID=7725 RepID=UPI00193A790C|nr:Kv channel-interacting protein 1-like isoform X2 [Styela clava]
MLVRVPKKDHKFVRSVRSGSSTLVRYVACILRRSSVLISRMAGRRPTIGIEDGDLWDREKIGVAIIGACAFMVILNRIHKYLPCLKCWKKDAEGDEVEYGPIRYVPHSLSSLTQTTKFTKEELKSMYRTFKNECPSGVVYEDTFKSIYSQFFPSGDSNMYAHYLFNAFDDNQEGYICFEDFVMSLSSLLRGKFEEKLQWIFKLYDINHDGFITKEEMQDIVKSVYSLTGSEDDESSPVYSYMEHANRVFRKLDQNNDGYVTYPEFVEACSRDPTVVASLKVFETAF